MADIFVSYAREDREAIRTLAAHLAQGGWSVWWDRHILAGKDFDDVLQCELDKARCVLVAWSSHSIASRWVKAEAGEGLRREILVPIQLDPALPPLGFRNIQTVTFTGLSLAAETPAFDDLIEALTALLGEPTPAPPPVLQPAPPQPVPPPAPPQPAPAPPAVHEVLATPEEDRVTRVRLPLAIAVILAIAAAGYLLLPFLRGGRGNARDYYAMGAVGPGVIRKDKQAYSQRWPDITLQLDGDVSVEDGNAPNTKLVRYVSVYHVGSAARNVHATGTTTTTLVVTLIDGALKIVDQKESVKATRQ